MYLVSVEEVECGWGVSSWVVFEPFVALLRLKTLEWRLVVVRCLVFVS
jgi:hypothetical protein